MRVEPGDPYPGDGVCPTRDEFYAVATKSYKHWSCSSHEPQHSDIEQNLFDLLAGVPLFSVHVNQRLLWVDGEWLYLKCKSEWETTAASACDVKTKHLTHYLRLGLSLPMRYQYEDAAINPTLSLGFGASTKMSSLIRAWCYILSCRWVESLTMAGQQAHLLQPVQMNLFNFWETAAQGEWRAIVIRDERTYHAPWSWSNAASLT